MAIRLLPTVVMASMVLVAVVDREAAGGEQPKESCTVQGFSYTQLCSQLRKSQSRPPELLDRLGRPKACCAAVTGEPPLARLEVTVDRQGRLVRARLVDSTGRCATKCLEHTFQLRFLPGSVAGAPTIDDATIVCKPTSAEERRAAEQGDEADER